MSLRIYNILALVSVMCGMSHAQTYLKFVDAETGEALIDLEVKLQDEASDETLYVRTDLGGMIQFPVKAIGNGITWSYDAAYLGYLPQTGIWDSSENLEISMQLDPKQLETLVVTAQYRPKSASEAIQNVKVLSRKQLDMMAAVNLRDALMNQLNIRISEDNILGSSMRIQGLSGENVKIMLDGVPIIGRLDGDLDLRQINLDQIERVEIIEGPLSVQYGTNALAGTINLISRKHAGSGMRAHYYSENVGTHNAGLQAHHTFGKHILGLSASRNFFDGWNQGDAFWPDFQKQLADSRRFKSWKPREQNSLALNYGFKLGRLYLGAKTQWFQELILNRGLPRPPYLESAFDDTYRTSRMDFSLSGEGFISDTWRMNIIAAANNYVRKKNTYIKNLTNLESTISPNPLDQDTAVFSQYLSRGSFQRLSGTSQWDLELGYDLNVESSSGLRIEGQKKQITDMALFATSEYTFAENWVIKSGLRVAHNSAYQAPLIPSVHLKGKIGQLTLRATWAKGFRAPAIKELYFYFVDINHNIIGNPDLKAEYSDNYSLNIKGIYEFSEIKTGWELGLFINDMHNLITLAQLPQGVEYTYINVGKNISKGIQSSVNITYGDWTAGMGTSLTGLYNQISGQSNSDHFNYSAEVNGSVNFTFPGLNMSLQFLCRFQGRQAGFSLLSEDQTEQTFIDPYLISDLTLMKKVWDNKIVLSLGCKNLWDVTQVNAGLATSVHSSAGGSVPVGMGRLLFFKVDYTFRSKSGMNEK